jgi:hypothetical protein
VALITGRRKVALGLGGEAELHTAQVCCDSCPQKAPGAEADTKPKAVALAVKNAEVECFVTHGKRWVCLACRLRSLPEQFRQWLPKLWEQYGQDTPKRRRRSR